VISTVSHAVNRIAGEKVVRQVKLQIMEKSKEIDLGAFDLPSFYEKLENANREAGSRPISFLSQTFTIISTIIEFISYVIILTTAPDLWWVMLIIIAMSVPTAVINFIYRRRNFQYMRLRSKERRQMNYFSNILVEKDLIKEVRLYDLADTFIGRFFDAFKAYYKGMRKLIVSETAWHIFFAVITGVINLCFYIIIALRVFTGQILIGDYTLYTGAIASVATCITTLINSTGTIYEGTLFIDNLIAFMDEKQNIKPLAEKGRRYPVPVSIPSSLSMSASVIPAQTGMC
jgi:ABC-type multidrug transport system fused ATPase/permease subunit